MSTPSKATLDWARPESSAQWIELGSGETWTVTIRMEFGELQQDRETELRWRPARGKTESVIPVTVTLVSRPEGEDAKAKFVYEGTAELKPVTAEGAPFDLALSAHWNGELACTETVLICPRDARSIATITSGAAGFLALWWVFYYILIMPSFRAGEVVSKLVAAPVGLFLVVALRGAVSNVLKLADGKHGPARWKRTIFYSIRGAVIFALACLSLSFVVVHAFVYTVKNGSSRKVKIHLAGDHDLTPNEELAWLGFPNSEDVETKLAGDDPKLVCTLGAADCDTAAPSTWLGVRAFELRCRRAVWKGGDKASFVPDRSDGLHATDTAVELDLGDDCRPKKGHGTVRKTEPVRELTWNTQSGADAKDHGKVAFTVAAQEGTLTAQQLGDPAGLQEVRVPLDAAKALEVETAFPKGDFLTRFLAANSEEPVSTLLCPRKENEKVTAWEIDADDDIASLTADVSGLHQSAWKNQTDRRWFPWMCLAAGVTRPLRVRITLRGTPADEPSGSLLFPKGTAPEDLEIYTDIGSSTPSPIGHVLCSGVSKDQDVVVSPYDYDKGPHEDAIRKSIKFSSGSLTSEWHRYLGVHPTGWTHPWGCLPSAHGAAALDVKLFDGSSMSLDPNGKRLK